MNHILKNLLKMVFFWDYRVRSLSKYYFQNKNKKRRRAVRILLKRYLERNYFVVLGEHSSVGENLVLPHPQNIVVGDYAVIGNNCTLYHGVTIGQSNGQYPQIGDNVIIYPGSKVIGGITIGNNVIIGANSVVTHNVPNNVIVCGSPAKILKERTNNY